MNTLRTNLHLKSALFGGLCTGLPLYGFYMYRTRNIVQPIDQNVIISNDYNNALDGNMMPSLKAQLLYKLFNFEKSEITKPEVLMECFILSLPILFTGILSYRLYLKNRLLWKNRHFYNSINISLNTITPHIKNNTNNNRLLYDLHVRTIIDKDINQIIPNEQGIKLLQYYAKQTNAENPFIEFDAKNDLFRKSINNLIKDHIVALSNQAYIHECLLDNDDIVRSKFLMVMTVWPQTQEMNKKIRVMLFKQESVRELLNNIGIEDDEEWMKSLEIGFKERWKLLYEITKKYKCINKMSLRYANDPYINQVELAVVNNRNTVIHTNMKQDKFL